MTHEQGLARDILREVVAERAAGHKVDAIADAGGTHYRHADDCAKCFEAMLEIWEDE